MWSLLCIPPLAAMVISDLRSRRIGTVHLIIFGITLLVTSLWDLGWCQALVNLSFNLLTVLFLCLFLYGYSRLRKMKLSEMIGDGDFRSDRYVYADVQVGDDYTIATKSFRSSKPVLRGYCFVKSPGFPSTRYMKPAHY